MTSLSRFNSSLSRYLSLGTTHNISIDSTSSSSPHSEDSDSDSSDSLQQILSRPQFLVESSFSTSTSKNHSFEFNYQKLSVELFDFANALTKFQLSKESDLSPQLSLVLLQKITQPWLFTVNDVSCVVGHGSALFPAILCFPQSKLLNKASILQNIFNRFLDLISLHTLEELNKVEDGEESSSNDDNRHISITELQYNLKNLILYCVRNSIFKLLFKLSTSKQRNQFSINLIRGCFAVVENDSIFTCLTSICVHLIESLCQIKADFPLECIQILMNHSVLKKNSSPQRKPRKSKRKPKVPLIKSSVSSSEKSLKCVFDIISSVGTLLSSQISQWFSNCTAEEQFTIIESNPFVHIYSANPGSCSEVFVLVLKFLKDTKAKYRLNCVSMFAECISILPSSFLPGTYGHSIILPRIIERSFDVEASIRHLVLVKCLVPLLRVIISQPTPIFASIFKVFVDFFKDPSKTIVLDSFLALSEFLSKKHFFDLFLPFAKPLLRLIIPYSQHPIESSNSSSSFNPKKLQIIALASLALIYKSRVAQIFSDYKENAFDTIESEFLLIPNSLLSVYSKGGSRIKSFLIDCFDCILFSLSPEDVLLISSQYSSVVSGHTYRPWKKPSIWYTIEHIIAHHFSFLIAQVLTTSTRKCLMHMLRDKKALGKNLSSIVQIQNQITKISKQEQSESSSSSTNKSPQISKIVGQLLNRQKSLWNTIWSSIEYPSQITLIPYLFPRTTSRCTIGCGIVESIAPSNYIPQSNLSLSAARNLLTPEVCKHLGIILSATESWAKQKFHQLSCIQSFWGEKTKTPLFTAYQLQKDPQLGHVLTLSCLISRSSMMFGSSFINIVISQISSLLSPNRELSQSPKVSPSSTIIPVKNPYRFDEKSIFGGLKTCVQLLSVSRSLFLPSMQLLTQIFHNLEKLPNKYLVYFLKGISLISSLSYAHSLSTDFSIFQFHNGIPTMRKFAVSSWYTDSYFLQSIVKHCLSGNHKYYTVKEFISCINQLYPFKDSKRSSIFNQIALVALTQLYLECGLTFIPESIDKDIEKLVQIHIELSRDTISSAINTLSCIAIVHPWSLTQIPILSVFRLITSLSRYKTLFEDSVGFFFGNFLSGFKSPKPKDPCHLSNPPLNIDSLLSSNDTVDNLISEIDVLKDSQSLFVSTLKQMNSLEVPSTSTRFNPKIRPSSSSQVVEISLKILFSQINDFPELTFKMLCVAFSCSHVLSSWISVNSMVSLAQIISESNFELKRRLFSMYIEYLSPHSVTHLKSNKIMLPSSFCALVPFFIVPYNLKSSIDHSQWKSYTEFVLKEAQIVFDNRLKLCTLKASDRAIFHFHPQYGFPFLLSTIIHYVDNILKTNSIQKWIQVYYSLFPSSAAPLFTLFLEALSIQQDIGGKTNSLQQITEISRLLLNKSFKSSTKSSNFKIFLPLQFYSSKQLKNRSSLFNKNSLPKKFQVLKGKALVPPFYPSSALPLDYKKSKHPTARIKRPLEQINPVSRQSITPLESISSEDESENVSEDKTFQHALEMILEPQAKRRRRRRALGSS